jgi:glycosyltransferase involved in cell wall biosynthesis
MNSSRVSILIPAYNAEPWLAQTLESAINQTWSNKEIILVDDGSKDRTCQIAEQFGTRGVRLVRQANQGAAAARNKAFSLCSGDYIQWLDADDLLSPDKIQRQMEVAQQCDSCVLLSAGWARFIHRPHKQPFVTSSLWCDLSPLEWLLRKLEKNLYMQTASWLPSRELTEAAGPWDTRLLGDDDGEYFCRVLLASAGTRFVSQARTYYRVAGASSLSYIGNSRKKLEAQFLSSRLHIEYIRSLSDDIRTRLACTAYLQRYLLCYYPEMPELVAASNELAAELGTRLSTPCMSWKYEWIRKAFGWEAAKRTQRYLSHYRSWFIASVDKGLSRMDAIEPRLKALRVSHSVEAKTAP